MSRTKALLGVLKHVLLTVLTQYLNQRRIRKDAAKKEES